MTQAEDESTTALNDPGAACAATGVVRCLPQARSVPYRMASAATLAATIMAAVSSRTAAARTAVIAAHASQARPSNGRDR